MSFLEQMTFLEKLKLGVHCFFAFITFITPIIALTEPVYPLLFVAAGSATLWFGFWHLTRPRPFAHLGYLSGRGSADLEAEIPPKFEAPPAPAMTPPQDGSISVSIKRTDEAVWVWLLVTETTKQQLSKVLKEPVDEFPMDMDEQQLHARQYIRDSDKIWANAHGDKRAAEHDEAVAYAKKTFLTPRYILLRDMLASPFRYSVSSAQEAAEYTDRLKKEVFPKIKAMIDAQARPETESFEL